MTREPYDRLSRLPSIVAATVRSHRSRPSSDRNRRVRRLTSWKRRHVQTPAMPDGAIVPAGSNRRSYLREIARREILIYGARLVTFNLAVAIIHLAALRWIWLQVGG